MGRGWFLKKSPLDRKALVFRRLPLPLTATEQRAGEDQGYAGKLSFFPFRTVRRERGWASSRGPRRRRQPPTPRAGTWTVM